MTEKTEEHGREKQKNLDLAMLVLRQRGPQRMSCGSTGSLIIPSGVGALHAWQLGPNHGRIGDSQKIVKEKCQPYAWIIAFSETDREKKVFLFSSEELGGQR